MRLVTVEGSSACDDGACLRCSLGRPTHHLRQLGIDSEERLRSSREPHPPIGGRSRALSSGSVANFYAGRVRRAENDGTGNPAARGRLGAPRAGKPGASERATTPIPDQHSTLPRRPSPEPSTGCLPSRRRVSRSSPLSPARPPARPSRSKEARRADGSRIASAGSARVNGALSVVDASSSEVLPRRSCWS